MTDISDSRGKRMVKLVLKARELTKTVEVSWYIN